MEVFIDSPTIARLLGFEEMKEKVGKQLTYVDQRVDFELQKTKKSLKRFTSSYLMNKLIESWGQEKYEKVVSELKIKQQQLTAERKKSLLFEDENGLWTYSGLGKRLAATWNCPVRIGYKLPESDVMPYSNLPKWEDRYYQIEAHDALLANAHTGPVGIELPTGSGKATIIRNVLKTLALGTVVMAPSVSIAGQLYDDLVHAFGKRYVGMYGDGKKQFDKLIVVGIDDSLTKIDPGSEAWAALSSKPVFFSDESHLTPANSLQKVCFGLMKNASYRFFCSATQMRNDGLDLVLEAITGSMVYTKTARELIDEGYLAKPVFKVVKVRSYSGINSDDANRMTRAHLYYNPIVARVAADLANKFVSLMQRPTIILVEELEQFAELLPHFKHKVAFAHGPLDKNKKKLVPAAYHSKGNKALVDAFNRGEIPILVGTSCIATGTDIQVAEAGLYLMGGKSEIKVKQAIGRETRGGFKGKVHNPWTGAQKLDCIHVDFKVLESGTDSKSSPVSRHSDTRDEIYASIYGVPEFIDYTNLV